MLLLRWFFYARELNTQMTRHNFLLPVFSGLLLLLSSPSIGAWPLIFVAFVPLLKGLEDDFGRGTSCLTTAFFKGYITGMFYTISLFYWIFNVSPLALLPIVLGFACMHGLLGVAVLFCLRAGYKGIVLSLWTAFAWISIEILGSDVLVSLPSYGVGYYLWSQPILIQLASITGVFGVSLWVVLINICLLRLLEDGLKPNGLLLILTVSFTVLVVSFGAHKVAVSKAPLLERNSLVVNAVHSHTSVVDKNSPEMKKMLFEQLRQLSHTTNITEEGGEIDLVVWPETSVPIFLRSVKERVLLGRLLNASKELQAPILMGALSLQRRNDSQLMFYNSAFLIPEKGFISQEYHKNILAPGVESTPFYSLLPAPIKEMFPNPLAAGKGGGVMRLGRSKKMGVFICWEVFFPDYVRTLADKDAGVLMNISNDEAAFGEMMQAYSIPLPHLVFRAVENNRFLVRSANWGASLFVAPSGEILQASEVGEEGSLVGAVGIIESKTFFTRHGFVWAKYWLTVTLLGLLYLLYRVYSLRAKNTR